MNYPTGYKLFRVRANNTLGPLFVGKRRVLPIGQWLECETNLPHPGLAHRPGWHVLLKPDAPHLSRKGRRMYQVAFDGELSREQRPMSQGGEWVTAQRIMIISAYGNP